MSTSLLQSPPTPLFPMPPLARVRTEDFPGIPGPCCDSMGATPLGTMRGRPLTTVHPNPYLVGQIVLAEGLLTLERLDECIRIQGFRHARAGAGRDPGREGLPESRRP